MVMKKKTKKSIFLKNFPEKKNYWTVVQNFEKDFSYPDEKNEEFYLRMKNEERMREEKKGREQGLFWMSECESECEKKCVFKSVH